MFDCVSHTMYISFSTICYRFTVLTFIALFNSTSVTYDSDFINIFIIEQFFISFSDKTSVTYKT